MGMQDYEAAAALSQQHSDIHDFVGPRSRQLVGAAEAALGLIFPPSYCRFMLEYGAGNFGSSEICGVIDHDFENSSVPDAIWFTRLECREIDLPKSLVVIHDTGGEDKFCLDSDGKVPDQEYPVIAYYPGYSPEAQSREVIAEDFGVFLLDLVQRELT